MGRTDGEGEGQDNKPCTDLAHPLYLLHWVMNVVHTFRIGSSQGNVSALSSDKSLVNLLLLYAVTYD